jgi:tetratricopeptide (TPR) repeat protein
MWAGQPSLSRLRRLGGKITDRAGREIDALPEATLSYVLRGERQPRAGFVRAFVAACLRARGRDRADVTRLVEQWHEAWLAATHPPSPALSQAGPAALIPRQLPPCPNGFVGRLSQQATLDAWLAGLDAAGSTRILTVEGVPGVGKTSLALCWAHRSSQHFADGQLYVNLRGFAAGPPWSPIQALTYFLRTLGVPDEQVPAGLEEATAMYRSLLAPRRILVVLDNAADSEQVRPLLPGGGGCAVLVTSRAHLGGLLAQDGARPLSLDVLEPAESTELLTAVLGAERVARSRSSMLALAELCGHLPLALRIAAARLATRPDSEIDSYLSQLRTSDRLTSLSVPGDPQHAVAAAFDLSYGRLSDQARRMFRLVGLAPGPDIATGAAAALAGLAPASAHELLGELARAHLVEHHLTDRFTCHDLLRGYAAGRAVREEPEPERRVALRRLYDWYLDRANAVVNVLYPHSLRLSPPPAAPPPADPGLGEPATALAWLDREQPNLVACVVDAAEHGEPRRAWLLSNAIRSYLWYRSFLADSLTVAVTGLSAVEQTGDERGQVLAELNLAQVHTRRMAYRAAAAHASRGVRLAERAGWREALAVGLRQLGGVWLESGRLDTAVTCFDRALAINRQLANTYGESDVLGLLAGTYRDLGRLVPAAAAAREALAITARTGSVAVEVNALLYLGDVSHKQGRYGPAIELLTRAVQQFKSLGSEGLAGVAQCWRARVHWDTGERMLARDLAREGLELAEASGHPGFHADALAVYATVCCGPDEPGRTAAELARAAEMARASGSRYVHAETLIELASTRLRTGERAVALREAQQARVMARRAGFRLLEAQAYTVLAEASLAAGDVSGSISYGQQALAIHREAGCRPGMRRVLALLDQAAPGGHQPGQGADPTAST